MRTGCSLAGRHRSARRRGPKILALLLIRFLGLIHVVASAGAAAAAESGAGTDPVERGRTVLLIVNPAVADPLVSRIEAELVSVGLAVRRVDVSSDSDLEAVVTRAMSAGASAAIRVIPRSSGTEVWTSDTRARVLRRRSIKANPSAATLSVLAFRSVEFLRASLLDVPGDRPPPAQPVGATADLISTQTRDGTSPEQTGAAVQAPSENQRPPARAEETATPAESASRAGESAAAPPPPSPRVQDEAVAVESLRREPASPRGGGFEALAGTAWWIGSRQLSAAPELAVGVRYRVSHALSAGPTALIPWSSQTVTTLEGTSAIALLFMGVSMEVNFPLTRRLGLQSGAAIGGIRFKATGNDPVHGLGRSDSTWNLAESLSLGATVALTRWLAARADLAGGVASHRIVVEHASREAADWGPVYLVAGAALQLSF